MRLLGLSVCLVCTVFILRDLTIKLVHGYNYHEQKKDLAPSVLEQQLRSVSSVEELMRIVYPTYWTMLKCRSKRGPGFHVSGQAHSDEPGQEPLRFAAAFSDLGIFKSIETEWRKTLCMPREVCLDVGKEFGAATNTFYKPPCVSVYRCGGCCNSEEYQCTNLSTSYISKTLFEITLPLTEGLTAPVTISFANHTLCHCLSKVDIYRRVHSIIRRSVPECNVANTTCPPDHSWNRQICQCVKEHDFTFPSEFQSLDKDICGLDKELDEESCQCVCSGRLGLSNCGPHMELDRHSCRCICKLSPASCGPGRVFNQDTCECTCQKLCPKHRPLNRTRCACECVESPNRCFLRGRRFHPATCSCQRPPCMRKRRRCEGGFYFSHEVCQCIPGYWKRLE